MTLNYGKIWMELHGFVGWLLLRLLLITSDKRKYKQEGQCSNPHFLG